MLFYEAYVTSGRRPSKNAIDGLHYALVLAPRDADLRIASVRQHLLDSRIADARAAFAPLAFTPHATSQQRKWTAKILEAMDRGDRERSLAAMNEWLSEGE